MSTMIEFTRYTQFAERLGKLKTFMRILMRHYQLQPGEENLCLISRYTNELEMEVRKVADPKENELLLRVGCCLISNYDSDLLMKFRGKDPSPDKSLILGTFGTGIVLESGHAVQGRFSPGDLVAFEPGMHCKNCSFCSEGKTNLCPNIKYLGSGEVDGILSRFVTYPAEFIHKLPQGISLELGTVATKIACCIHAYQRSKVTKDSKILIMGISLVGLIAIMIFKHKGVGRIIVAGTNNYKLRMAKTAGADYVIKLTSLYSPEYPEYLREIIKSVQSEEPDIVVDTLGSASSIENSFNLTKSGGTMVLMNHMIRSIETKLVHTTLREIDIIGAYSYTHSSFVEAMELLSNKNIPLNTLIPIKIPLERALDGFSLIRSTGGENLFMLINSYDENQGTSEEKTASIPEVTLITQSPDLTKGTTHTDLSTKPIKSAESSTEPKATESSIDPSKPPTGTELSTDPTKPSSGTELSTDQSKPTTSTELSTKPTTGTELSTDSTKPSSGTELSTDPSKPTTDTKLSTDQSKPPTSTELSTKPTTGTELSTTTDPEKGREEKSSITEQNDKLDKNDKEKVTSTSSPTDDKNKEVEKERIFQVILQPKSVLENKNQPWPEDDEMTTEKNKTEKDLSSNKPDEKLNNDKNKDNNNNDGKNNKKT